MSTLKSSAEDLTLNADGSGNDVIIQSNASTKVTVDGSAGDVKVESGDLFFATAGKGIVLGATSNTDANTLEDYEEGTWSPTAESGHGSLTVDSVTNSYTKIGNTVICVGGVAWSGSGQGSGDLKVGGLPFASSSTFQYRPAVHIFLEECYSSVPNGVTGYVQGNNTYFVIREQSTTGGGNDVGAHIDGGTGLMLLCIYQV